MKRIIVLINLFLIVSCARQGSPSGGPKDELPPAYLKSTPDTLSINVSTNLKEINIYFDEYMVLKEYNKNLIVSPPFKKPPIFSPLGNPKKSIRIRFQEELLPHTTYNINFGNAIQDHNESNKLSGFNYVFSTGNYIDSLFLKGKVYSSLNRKMPENILVGLYQFKENYNDSIIIKEKPYYITRLDSLNQFQLNYLKDGKYKLIAFEDKIENTQYDLGREKMAFYTDIIELNTAENKEINIPLFDQKMEYRALKAEQKAYGHLVFKVQGNPEEVNIHSIGREFKTQKMTFHPKEDSINFWFNPKTDTVSAKAERFRFVLENSGRLDTLTVAYKTSETPKLSLNETKRGLYNPVTKFQLLANTPLKIIESQHISVFKDSLSIPFKVVESKKRIEGFEIDFPIEFNHSYSVNLYPKAVTDLFDEVNDTISYRFKVGAENEFGNLNLKLENKPDKPFWIQFYDEKDQLLDEQYTTSDAFSYRYLRPNKVYFKILVDENENGIWDTGDYFKNKQPEPSYIYPALIDIRAYWDANEVWVLPDQPKV